MALTTELEHRYSTSREGHEAWFQLPVENWFSSMGYNASKRELTSH